MIKNYYRLTKPGIIYGNAITTIAGFLLASKGHVNFGLLLAALAGVSLVIASACVFNNLLDRDIDSKMERTRNRAMVSGTIPKHSAVIFGIVLIVLGSFVLAKWTNLLTLSIGLAGFLVYVALYTPLKRRSVHGTLVGAVAGAVPPVVGYCAVSNKFDLGAVLLFLILVSWQMPHFYAIAIRRLDDYAKANIPVLPVKKGIYFTKINILIYTLLFIVLTILMFVYRYTGYLYLAAAVLLGLYWLTNAAKGFRDGMDDKAWARKMFLISLIVLTTLSIAISIDSFLPNRL
jgi:protoheme IX farnesyltransferase